MSQICASEPIARPSIARHDGAWTRFVRAIDAKLATAVDTLLVWQRRHRDRMHLMSMDDRLLRDIGISYADVDHEASKPFWRG